MTSAMATFAKSFPSEAAPAIESRSNPSLMSDLRDKSALMSMSEIDHDIGCRL